MRTRHDPATQPYYKCLSCQRFRHICAGYPTRDMNLQEWCEYIRDVRDVAHITNAYIAKESGVSLKTIERIMAISHEQDFMRETARKIERAVIGNVTKFQCYNDGCDSEKISQMQTAIDHLLKENARYAKIIDKYIE